MATPPTCNYAELTSGSVGTIPSWNMANLKVPVGVCFPFPGDGTKYGKLLCKDAQDAVTTTKAADVKAYQYADEKACEADAVGASANEFTTGATTAIGGIVKGGDSNAGMCDAEKCVAGTDYFLARSKTFKDTCEEEKFDEDGKDWYIQFTNCEPLLGMGAAKYECHGNGGIKQTMFNDCSSAAGSSTPTAKDACKGSTKWQTDCGGDGEAGANSLSGKVIVGLMAAILTAMVMI